MYVGILPDPPLVSFGPLNRLYFIQTLKNELVKVNIVYSQ